MASSSTLAEFTDANFASEVLASDQVVLVDFTGDWCQPCKMLAPTIERLARDYVGCVKFGRIEAAENRDVSLRYNIQALPTVVLFHRGEAVSQFRGLRPESDYRAAIDELLA